MPEDIGFARVAPSLRSAQALRRGGFGRRPLSSTRPRRGLADVEQRAQVAVGVWAERRRLSGELGHCAGQRIAAVFEVAPGTDELVVLLTCPVVGGTQLPARLAQLVLRVEYLVADLLVLRAAGPLVNAQPFRARRVPGLVLGEQLGGLVILAA